MRYFKNSLVFLAVILLFISSLGLAQKEIDFNAQSIIELRHNFKQARQGDEVNHVFGILNNSKYPWRIEDLRTTCHCTEAKILDQNQKEVEIQENQEVLSEILPGEHLFVKMSIDSNNYDGEVEQMTYVRLGYSDKKKTIKLIMQGEVIAKE